MSANKDRQNIEDADREQGQKPDPRKQGQQNIDPNQQPGQEKWKDQGAGAGQGSGQGTGQGTGQGKGTK